MISYFSVSRTEVNNDSTSNYTIVKPRDICSFFIFYIKLTILLMVSIDHPKYDKFLTKYFVELLPVVLI